MAIPASYYEADSRSLQAVPASSVADDALPTTRRGIAGQAAAALGMLTGLWVALSPLFLVLQHGGNNASIANVIAGLVVAAFGAFALISRRGFAGLQFASLVLGVWVLISSFILNARFSIAAPMFWSNSWSGVILALLALGALATLRPSRR
jgi:hypothetical protein